MLTWQAVTTPALYTEIQEKNLVLKQTQPFTFKGKAMMLIVMLKCGSKWWTITFSQQGLHVQISPCLPDSVYKEMQSCGGNIIAMIVVLWRTSQAGRAENHGNKSDRPCKKYIFCLPTDHCRDSGVVENSQSWEQITQAVQKIYLLPAHQSLKMNEFFWAATNQFDLGRILLQVCNFAMLHTPIDKWAIDPKILSRVKCTFGFAWINEVYISSRCTYQG